ncbi:nucleotide sugar dehydrogenase [Brevibacillus fulvus]|uniref:UDP-N-acetyl-D-glucosamine dehydrogenase n=1 Tax=Brevibacillus fulvus TaxID=1125967 RepID=A0A939BT16_9BACL|nr:nucleotide sugar dehydrogenase [Brevibacillus fulvus]MBM7589039.1 UDP-N-acetyl-D-glucosamine dehydrogenase [Brevibacillus fulvus]
MSTNSSIAVIGLGYVGLPLAQLFVAEGYRVIGVDIDQAKIESIQQKKSYVSDISDADLRAMVESSRFEATPDFRRVQEADYIVICVPTPLTNREPDITYIKSAVTSIAPYLRENQTVILESSTYPGTTEEIVKPLLEQNPQSLIIGQHLYLGYSPERIDPGNKQLTLRQIPKVISGVTSACLEKVKAFYGQVFETIVPVTSTKVAEFVKMLENSQRLINISFINEVNLLANRMQVDLWEVIEAAKSKPLGFTPYYPSAGIGGHCIPVDPFFLSWIGLREGVPLTMIHLAGMINERMPHEIVGRVLEELDKKGIDPQNASVGIIGLTYKKDVNDIRESAALRVIEHLLMKKVNVSVYDPMYTGEPPFQVNRFELTPEALGKQDIVVVLVDHSAMDWQQIAMHSQCVIDTRNIVPNQAGTEIIRI